MLASHGSRKLADVLQVVNSLVGQEKIRRTARSRSSMPPFAKRYALKFMAERRINAMGLKYFLGASAENARWPRMTLSTTILTGR